MTPIPLSLYIHFPWCLQKCPYCDFNSHEVKQDIPEQAYIDALIKDLEQELPHIWGRRIHTVFIGGGTPSLISPEGISDLLTRIGHLLPLRPQMEITLEANPGTFEQARFQGYLQAGISRLSLGIQSFNPQHLQKLGRIHDHQEALHAVRASRAAGFDNINLDLMFGLPEQSLEQALADLQQAIELQPDHISWYELTLEPNTFFHHSPPPLPDEDAMATIQQEGSKLLTGAGYQGYEVSAWSHPGRACQHNLNYWEFGDYIGIGAGAHGKYTLDGKLTRYQKIRHPRDYINGCLANKPRSSSTTLDPADLVFEFMLNALRLKQGFKRELFTARTALPLQALDQAIREAVNKGLLQQNGEIIQTTAQGWQYLNTTIEHFLPEK